MANVTIATNLKVSVSSNLVSTLTKLYPNPIADQILTPLKEGGFLMPF